MDYDKKLFKGKTFSKLLEEIYGNSVTTRGQIYELIRELRSLIDDLQDATVIVPLIKGYLELGVKNDEHLIKLATVIQRIETAQAKDGEEDIWGELQRTLEESESTGQKLLRGGSKNSDETT